jgi:dienelactone hydrolase
MTALACLLCSALRPTAPVGFAQEPAMIVTATNPEPARLPTLGVWQRDELTLVSARFPNVPDFTCDSWCYESDVDFVGATALDGGGVELRHRMRETPNVLWVTTVTPDPGAVEFTARIVVESGEPPAWVPCPNLCWQLRRAPLFASAPDPYPEFVKRCFIFTREGVTFLDRTERRPIPVRAADDPYNNPVWVQMYVGEWQDVPQVGPTSWADYSPDRYTTTVIGAVSRDGKYLTAIANDSAPLMCQAWHDCMHNNPLWLPVNTPPTQQEWRVRIYAMENEPDALLARVARDFPLARHAAQRTGVIDSLPVTRDALAERLTFPLSWTSGRYDDFARWKRAARRRVMECLLPPPPSAPFDPQVVAEEDRGSYTARKLVVSLTGDSRVLAYMTVPKGDGPFPAVLLLHDHGARFDIGKEKMIRPFGDTPERMASAQEWVDTCYGGRWLGDELARRGYVCFSHDALNWSDRGGAEYEGQQALAGNLLHLGTSLAGTIAHEDLRAAEFLATRPEVDRRRVGAMGLSMGCFRTWQVAALSDRIKAGVAVCWMATVKGLMTPGNNQTRGQSCYAFLHPGLYNYLDYPDVASLACPKPMLFYNGRQDGLFPVPSVEEAYAKMRAVWESQGAGDRLVTRLWDVPHEFNAEMQDEAFAWLEGELGQVR